MKFLSQMADKALDLLVPSITAAATGTCTEKQRCCSPGGWQVDYESRTVDCTSGLGKTPWRLHHSLGIACSFPGKCQAGW
ncbi:hypothetical protein GCM10027605_30440 [Micromonospora zhanjiangensis]